MAKDAVAIAQKADNIDLVQKIMELQSMGLDMQHALQEKDEQINHLKTQLSELQHKAQYQYEEGHRWMINPKNPDIKLCPTCLSRDGFESPLSEYDEDYMHCGNCRNIIK